MKTCPKCNEILGDSAKVCVNCRYQFEPDELQAVLERSENAKKIAKKEVDRDNKIKDIVFIVFLVLFFVMLLGILAVIAFRHVYGTHFRLVENGIMSSGSDVIPYRYTVYWDHAEINQYYGDKNEVEIPSHLWGRPVTVIGEYFCYEFSVVKVKIPGTVIEIEDCAFQECDELVEVTGGKSVKTVGENAFLGCKKLEVIDLGTKIERIEDGVLEWCDQLKQFPRQDNLEYIGRYAFAHSGLEEFEFSSDVDVQSRAFMDTPWQNRQPEQFIIFGDGALQYYNGPEGRIVIPDGVKTMLGDSFIGLADSEIFVPQTVQKIEYYSFVGCANIKIYIPSSVEEMGVQTEDYDLPMIGWNCSDVTIVTTKGSYAERYAREHEIPCELVEGW